MTVSMGSTVHSRVSVVHEAPHHSPSRSGSSRSWKVSIVVSLVRQCRMYNRNRILIQKPVQSTLTKSQPAIDPRKSQGLSAIKN